MLEYLSQVAPSLPASARPQLGPDATGVGWVYQYALVDRTGKHDLSQLTSLQNWFLKYELKTVPDVAEVASIGGMVRQFQVVVDPGQGWDLELTIASADGRETVGRQGAQARPPPESESGDLPVGQPYDGKGDKTEAVATQGHDHEGEYIQLEQY